MGLCAGRMPGARGVCAEGVKGIGEEKKERCAVQDNDMIQSADTYISVDEMAKILSIARATAYQLTKTQDFPCFYIGKRIIIPLQSFHAWAAGQALKQATIL